LNTTPTTETLVHEIGATIKSVLPEGVGFALLFFSLGAGGTMAYCSNAKREDMIAALLELVAQLESHANRREIIAALKDTVEALEQRQKDEG
jgi:hypothetical protein